jgi:hypothetical protein
MPVTRNARDFTESPRPSLASLDCVAKVALLVGAAGKKGASYVGVKQKV